ncbi:LacI family DNA-binding transcriptional regulator [Streptomyces fuscichromogenes]|uniref:LacI family DNA-binding transcriptional regulator n=1 Tax=Streptomyces fuscichromogenes TaxID=1324013 RepID=UPI003826727A
MARSQGGAGRSGASRGPDVARWARASRKTVSRAFDHEASVPAQVRTSVFEAAGELGYRLNQSTERVARSTVHILEDEPGGITGAIGALLDQAMDDIVISGPLDEEDEEGDRAALSREGDAPVPVLGGPIPFEAARILSAGWRRPAGAGGHRVSAGSEACDRSSPRRSATAVRRPVPS